MNVIAFIWQDIPWKISIIIYMAIICRLMYHTQKCLHTFKKSAYIKPTGNEQQLKPLLAEELDKDYIVKIYIPFLTIHLVVSKLT